MDDEPSSEEENPFRSNFPPTSQFTEEDNKYLAKMIKFVWRDFNKRLSYLHGKIEDYKRRLETLERQKNYEEGMEEGRRSLVKWVTILLSILVAGASILYYLTSVFD